MLPVDIRRQAIRSYGRWRSTPGHPSLQFKCVNESASVFSVRIGLHWRALAYRDAGPAEDIVTWFWIGSHSDYDRLIAEL